MKIINVLNLLIFSLVGNSMYTMQRFTYTQIIPKLILTNNTHKNTADFKSTTSYQINFNKEKLQTLSQDIIQDLQPIQTKPWTTFKAPSLGMFKSTQPLLFWNNSTDPYSVLGIQRNATQDKIKTAYKQMALKYHPDKSGNKEDFHKIQNAYNQLIKNNPNTENPENPEGTIKEFIEFHEKLVLKLNCSPEELDDAYQKNASKYHPHNGGNEKDYIKFTQSYQKIRWGKSFVKRYSYVPYLLAGLAGIIYISAKCIKFVTSTLYNFILGSADLTEEEYADLIQAIEKNDSKINQVIEKLKDLILNYGNKTLSAVKSILSECIFILLVVIDEIIELFNSLKNKITSSEYLESTYKYLNAIKTKLKQQEAIISSLPEENAEMDQNAINLTDEDIKELVII